jgi:hypothetical protein
VVPIQELPEFQSQDRFSSLQASLPLYPLAGAYHMFAPSQAHDPRNFAVK